MENFSKPIPLSAITQDVDPQLDYAGTIAPIDTSLSQPLNRRGKRPLPFEGENENGNGIMNINGDGEQQPNMTNNLKYQVDQHLSLLQQPPYIFTTKRTISSIPNWTVEFRHLSRKLRHQEIESIIETRYGDVALRIIRVLQTKGKLDEKRLQEISLLPFKDLRQVLASMQTGNFIDLQEVPRDGTRQPSRTIFLWSYDPDRLSSSILEDVYKSMSRCLQRIKFEHFRLKDFLDKADREDIKGREELYLSEAELVTLEQWRAKEALLLGEVDRLDDIVAAFRDY